jgi:hypothetical protein
MIEVRGLTKRVPALGIRDGIAGTLRSEFTKVRSVRSTYWTLILLMLAGIGWPPGASSRYSAATRSSCSSSARCCSAGVTFSPWS